MIKGEPTRWLVFLPLSHCVGFEEAQNEKENCEWVFLCGMLLGGHWGSLLRRVGVPEWQKRDGGIWRMPNRYCCGINLPPVTSLQAQKCRLHSQNMSGSVVWKIESLIVELEDWGTITLMWNILSQNNNKKLLFELCYHCCFSVLRNSF